jgi:hypothetical protein
MIALILMNRHRHPERASQNPTLKPFLPSINTTALCEGEAPAASPLPS